MISETLALNEFPVIYLKHLLVDLEAAQKAWYIAAKVESPTTNALIEVVKSAIKDAEEREQQLPFK